MNETETETKKGITDGLANKILINNVMSPHVCNVNMNCLALPNKCSNMQTEKMICKNIENDASEIDYNDLAFRKQSQLDFEYDDNSSSEIATKYQFQNLTGEFFYKEKFNSLLDFVVKKESHIDVEYDSLRCEVTPENQYQCLKSVFLDAKEEIHSSLDLGIKKENQIDLEFDEWPNYNTTIENQYKDLKKEFLNDKEIHLSSDLLRMETCKFESFDQNEKQESKSLNIPNHINSFSYRSETETKKDITNSLANKSSADKVKSLNLGNVNMNCFVVLNKCPNRKNIKVKSVKNFDGSVSYYEVFERRKCGVKTVIFKSLICPYTTTSKQNIIQHCKAHKRNKNHNCLDCSFSAKCLFLLKLHKKTHLENRFECTICSFSTTSATTLRSHRLYKHIIESSRPKTYRASKLRQRSSLCRTTYNCNMCIFKTRDMDNYQEHKKIQNKRVLKHQTKLKNFQINSVNLGDDDDEIKDSHNRHKQSKMDNSLNNYEVVKRTKNGTSIIIFKSLQCPYTTNFRYKIINHCKTHLKNKSYNCLDCNFKAKCLFLLKLHKKTHVENNFKCLNCPFSTTSIKTLSSHRSSKHKLQSTSTYRASKLRQRSSICGTIYNCNMCIFKTRDMDNYQEHKKIHLKRVLKHQTKLKSRQGKQVLETKTIKSKDIAKKNFECKKCSFVTDDMENMSKHKQTHLKSLENDTDFIKDSSEVKLEEPKSLLTQTTLSCSSCSFTTPLKIVLLKHKQSHTSSPPGVFKCTECCFSTLKYKVLISHLMNHAYKYVYRCLNCNFSSNKKVTFKSHKDSHRKIRKKTNIRNFRKNKITVSLQAKNNKTFKCFSCDYTCSSEYLLNQHSLTHLEYKLLKCAHCDYQTNFKGNLVKHVLIHVSEYEEDICETTYNCNMCIFTTRDVNSCENHSVTCFRSMTEGNEIKTSDSSSSARVNDQTNCNDKQTKETSGVKTAKSAKIAKKKFKCGKCSFVTVTVDNLSKHKRTHIKPSGKDEGCAKDLSEGKLEEPEIVTSPSVKLENESPNISNSINSVRDRNETETKKNVIRGRNETKTEKDVTDKFPKKSSAENVRSLNLGNVNMNCCVELNKCPNLKNFKVNSENISDDDDDEMKGSHNRHKQSKMDNKRNLTNIFKSLQCPYTTNFRCKIINHCKTHLKNKSYNCLDCNFKAKCLFLLKRHRKTHVENNFKCLNCSFSTTSIWTLRSHRFYKHKLQSTSTYRASKLRQRSSLCGTTSNCNTFIFKTRDMDNYQEHKKIHLKRVLKHQKKLKSRQGKQVLETKTIKSKEITKVNFKCKKCSFVTDDMENMSKHNQSHIKSLENDNDFFKDSLEVKLQEHKSLLTQTTLSCNSCSFTTPLKIVLLKHKQSHTSSPPGVFKCTECCFSTLKYKVLISHLMNHAYKYVYRCLNCNFSSNKKVTFKSHKDSHRKIRKKTNIRNFRKNKITVSLQAKNNKTFKCIKCDYSCPSEHLLNQHSLTHLESKLLKCAHCDYQTNFKGNLVRHVLIHVSEYEEHI
ncbi:Zinc finger protein, partial [Armadillidium nasatum]